MLNLIWVLAEIAFTIGICTVVGIDGLAAAFPLNSSQLIGFAAGLMIPA